MTEYQPLSEKTEILPDFLTPLDSILRIKSQINTSRYSKLTSIIRLRSAGLPTLPGFVVENLTDEVLAYLGKWNESLGAKRLSLRFDSPNPEDHKRLLGSNPTLKELSQMKSFFEPPVIGIIFTENDRFNQNHSVLTYFLDECILCEIVGPGFDAADLTRGNTLPHESLEILRKDNKTSDVDLHPSDIKNHTIVDSETYLLSRQIRYGIIHSILEKGLGKAVESIELTIPEKSSVEKFLQRRGTEIPTTYQPLGPERLCKLYKYLVNLDIFRAYYKDQFQLDVEKKVLSASFLKKYGLVFWDLYGADKYTKR